MMKMIILNILFFLSFSNIIAGKDEKSCLSFFSKIFTAKYKNENSDFKAIRTTRHFLIDKEIPALRKGGHSLEAFFVDFFYPILKLLSPIPLKDYSHELYTVFHKLWLDISYKPTEREILILKKYKALDLFEDRRLFLEKHPVWAKNRKRLGRVFNNAKFLSFFIAASLLFEEKKVFLQNFLREDQFLLKGGDIQILNDVVPFPHTAIRIGNKVYSYGQTHLYVKTVEEYLKLRTIKREKGEIDFSKLSTLNGLIEFSGLNDLSQSLQVVTIHLSIKERNALKRYLEMQTAKRYLNITFVNDCTTMAVRALSLNTGLKFNPLIDASPSQFLMSLSLKKMAGDKRIGSFYLLLLDQKESFLKHQLRDTYINMIESKIFIELALLNWPWRFFVDLFYDKNKLQYYGPEVLKEIEAWKLVVKKSLENDPEFLLLQEKLKRRSDLVLKESLKEKFEMELKNAQDEISYYDSDFKTIIFAKYRLELLKEMYEKIKKREE